MEFSMFVKSCEGRILIAFVVLSTFLGNAESNGCIYNVMAKEGVIASPNFPNKYPSEKDCRWKFVTTPGYKIKLIFDDFELENDEKCNYDYVALYDGHSINDTLLGKFCGKKIPSPIFSTSNRMLMVFHSDSRTEFTGFRATYKAGCFFKMSSREGVVTSPHYPEKYPGLETCTYEFEANWTDKIKLMFDSFDLEYESKCAYDSVSIYDGNSINGTLLGRFCGNIIPPNITSTTNKMLMIFRSDPYAEFSGFKATFQTVSWVCRYEL